MFDYFPWTGYLFLHLLEQRLGTGRWFGKDQKKGKLRKTTGGDNYRDKSSSSECVNHLALE